MYALRWWRVICRDPDSSPLRTLPKPSGLTTEPPAPGMGWGDPSGFEHDPLQDLLRVSLSGVGWQSDPWRDADNFMPLTTGLRE